MKSDEVGSKNFKNLLEFIASSYLTGKLMTRNEIKTAYESLEPISTHPMDDTWVDKLIPFERFIENGPNARNLFHNLSDSSREKAKALHPKLYELVLTAFDSRT